MRVFTACPTMCVFNVQEYLMQQLESQGIQPLPKTITNEVGSSDRLDV